ncbi:LexA family protein [Sedimentibacter acidaminivorans]|uniref:LexA family protein n=1 Tax=Sedimentibacter acidaminivorans TaxID=913099 RepID=UPI003CC91ACE
MKYLTNAQYEVIKCIDDYTKSYGYPPTYREIAILTNRVSVSTIYCHIQLLLKKEYITMQENSPRTIKIISDFDETHIKKLH